MFIHRLPSQSNFPQTGDRRPNPDLEPEHPLPGQTNKLSLLFSRLSLGPQKPHLVWGPFVLESWGPAYRYNCCLKGLWSEWGEGKCKCSRQLQVEHFCELFSHYEQIKFIVRPLAESWKSPGNAGDFPSSICAEWKWAVCKINPTSWQLLWKIHFNTRTHFQTSCFVLRSLGAGAGAGACAEMKRTKKGEDERTVGKRRKSILTRSEFQKFAKVGTARGQNEWRSGAITWNSQRFPLKHFVCMQNVVS